MSRYLLEGVRCPRCGGQLYSDGTHEATSTVFCGGYHRHTRTMDAPEGRCACGHPLWAPEAVQRGVCEYCWRHPDEHPTGRGELSWWREADPGD